MKLTRAQKLKLSGMVVAVLVVVGVTAIIANSKFTGGLAGGVSADLGDLATGKVVVLSQETYDTALAKLTDYFGQQGSQSTQDKIVADVVKMLQDAVK